MLYPFLSNDYTEIELIEEKKWNIAMKLYKIVPSS